MMSNFLNFVCGAELVTAFKWSNLKSEISYLEQKKNKAKENEADLKEYFGEMKAEI